MTQTLAPQGDLRLPTTQAPHKRRALHTTVLSAVSLAAALFTAGCGGGSDSASSNTADASAERASAQATTPPADAIGGTSPMTPAAAVRFINQATFGARDADIEPLRQSGRLAWIRNQYAIPVQKTHWDAVQGAINSGPASNWQMQSESYRSYIGAPDQLRKRVAAALLEILVVADRVGPVGGLEKNHLALAAYVDLLEANAFGNFRNLLGDVAHSPAMGAYLTFNGNTKATYAANGSELTVPDENFARELMQLFTIGLYQINGTGIPRLGADGKPIETYTQSDVSNLARVFTGFGFDKRATAPVSEVRNPMVVTASKHSPEAIKFLTANIPAGTSAEAAMKTALDTLFAHNNVGQFIGRQLIQRLVTSNPSPGYVTRVTAKFNDNGSGVRGDMRAVIEAVLLDNEATAEVAPALVSSYRGKPREPMFRLAATMRTLGMDSTAVPYPVSVTGFDAQGLGQTPLRSDSVFNFFRPGFVPANSELGDAKLTVPEFQIINGASIPASINYLNGAIRNAPNTFNVQNLAPLNSVAADAPALVQKLNLLLTASTLDNDSKTEIVNAVAAIPATDSWKRISAATMLITSSPAFLIQK